MGRHDFANYEGAGGCHYLGLSGALSNTGHLPYSSIYRQSSLQSQIQQPVSKDVLGYKAKDGAVVRYRVSSNDFVKGYLDGGIATMYKPKGNPEKGRRYFLKKQSEESVDDD